MLRDITPLWKQRKPSLWEIGDRAGNFLIIGKTYCIHDGEWLYTAVPLQYDGFMQLIDYEADLHTVEQLQDLIEEERQYTALMAKGSVCIEPPECSSALALRYPQSR